MLAGLSERKSQLKPTTTHVRHLYSNLGEDIIIRKRDERRRVVLVLSKHFTTDIPNWINAFVPKVLLTDTKVKEQLRKLQDQADAHTTDRKSSTQEKRSGDGMMGYIHIEAVDHFESSGMVELLAQRLHEEYQFTHVVALVEQDLIRAARIRELLGIQYGQSLKSALRFRDKIIMKQVLVAHDIAVPTFAPMDSVTDLLSFIKQHQLPVVVKPRKGHSSIGAHVLRDQLGLMRYLHGLGRGSGSLVDSDVVLDLDVEKFVKGQMYHVDGFVLKGEVKLVWPSRYVNDCANFTENKFLASISLSPSNPLVPRMQRFFLEVIQALLDSTPITVKTNLCVDKHGDVTFGIVPHETCGEMDELPIGKWDQLPSLSFHGEAWHTDDDRIVLCEIASRTGQLVLVLTMNFGSGACRSYFRDYARKKLLRKSRPLAFGCNDVCAIADDQHIRNESRTIVEFFQQRKCPQYRCSPCRRTMRRRRRNSTYW